MFYKNDYILFVTLFSMLTASASVAETEIHRCAQEDGTVAFQEKPCEEVGEASQDSGETHSPASEDDFFDFVNPFDEPQGPSAETERVSQDRAECEKTTRDAIDAIDLEMRETSYTKEEGDE